MRPRTLSRHLGQYLLFLDVDGVLNSLAWFAAHPPQSPCSVDMRAVRRILHVCERTGASIVLSSSWRHEPALVGMLRGYGLPIVGLTPVLLDQPRGAEIRAWLARHPEVTQFAAIDDDGDAGHGIEAHFVRTYPKHGMYGKHERCLIAILGESEHA